MDIVCNKCKDPKDESEFYKVEANANGLHKWCKKCCRSYNTSDKMKVSQAELRARYHKDSLKLIIETGGTTVGGYKFVVLDHKKITGSGVVNKFNNEEYIKTEGKKIFEFLTDNVPVKVFEELSRLVIGYDVTKASFELDMNKFNKVNKDLINLQKEKI